LREQAKKLDDRVLTLESSLALIQKLLCPRLMTPGILLWVCKIV
jgi:hypothetical protein